MNNSIDLVVDNPEEDDELIAARKIVAKLESEFSTKLVMNRDLDRSIVSFQANKSEPIFRWFKYREGFSKTLIDYIIHKEFSEDYKAVLDPFGGTGATAFVASQHGYQATLIELLPVGCFFIKARELLAKIDDRKIIKWARLALKEQGWRQFSACNNFKHITITAGAFSSEAEACIASYREWITTLKPQKRHFFDFVLFSILEEISYTRKDGQYLRWDYRSPRTQSKFSKGKILSFEEAINAKLRAVVDDLEAPEELLLFPNKMEASTVDPNAGISLFEGSVFQKINEIPDNSIDAVVTSPPYCNRYDYTRTYALELAYLGVGEHKIRELRQNLLSCTVENKKKDFSWLARKDFITADKAYSECVALQAALKYLKSQKEKKLLNNNGIVTMVDGYFYEMAIHLSQVFNKIKSGGKYVMVNDNVRYNGLDIPVDCILSDIAESIGFNCDKIWVLPKGKGNSSQQMKRHGRSELRKCVYVWSKR